MCVRVCACMRVCLCVLCVCVVQIVEGGNGDREFEDRFLQCFGLVDPAPDPSREPRTASEASAEERRQSLRRQAETSPWYIYRRHLTLRYCKYQVHLTMC